MSVRRDLAVLGGRTVLGGYLAIHGAQKLFAAFDGPGLDRLATGFDRQGLRPGKLMATAAGVSEFGGGLLTLAGLAHPVGPVAISGTMAVAATTHRKNGPLAQKGGYELALTNLGAGLVLSAIAPGRFSIDGIFRRRLPKPLVALTVLFGIAAAGHTIKLLLTHTPAPAPEPKAEAAPEGAPQDDSSAQPAESTPSA